MWFCALTCPSWPTCALPNQKRACEFYFLFSNQVLFSSLATGKKETQKGNVVHVLFWHLILSFAWLTFNGHSHPRLHDFCCCVGLCFWTTLSAQRRYLNTAANFTDKHLSTARNQEVLICRCILIYISSYMQIFSCIWNYLQFVWQK